MSTATERFQRRLDRQRLRRHRAQPGLVKPVPPAWARTTPAARIDRAIARRTSAREAQWLAAHRMARAVQDIAAAAQLLVGREVRVTNARFGPVNLESGGQVIQMNTTLDITVVGTLAQVAVGEHATPDQDRVRLLLHNSVDGQPVAVEVTDLTTVELVWEYAVDTDDGRRVCTTIIPFGQRRPKELTTRYT